VVLVWVWDLVVSPLMLPSSIEEMVDEEEEMVDEEEEEEEEMVVDEEEEEEEWATWVLEVTSSSVFCKNINNLGFCKVYI